MAKYSISNCPAMTDQGNCFQGSLFLGTAYQECCERTDCLLKQIVEKCKTKIEDDVCLNCNDFKTQRTCYECDYEHHREDIYYKRANVCFAQELLSMLEIQECE